MPTQIGVGGAASRRTCEHDLYDRLQLIQLLDRFEGRDLGTIRLTFVCVDDCLGTLIRLLEQFPPVQTGRSVLEGERQDRTLPH